MYKCVHWFSKSLILSFILLSFVSCAEETQLLLEEGGSLEGDLTLGEQAQVKLVYTKPSSVNDSDFAFYFGDLNLPLAKKDMSFFVEEGRFSFKLQFVNGLSGQIEICVQESEGSSCQGHFALDGSLDVEASGVYTFMVTLADNRGGGVIPPAPRPTPTPTPQPQPPKMPDPPPPVPPVPLPPPGGTPDYSKICPDGFLKHWALKNNDIRGLTRYPIAPGVTKRFCVPIEAPYVDPAKEIGQIVFVWNDEPDFICSTLEASMQQTFPPYKKMGPSTANTGHLRFNRRVFKAPDCEECVQRGVYVVTLTGKKVFNPSVPNCSNFMFGWKVL